MRVLFSSVNLITFFFFHLVSSHPNEEQVFHFYNEILSHLQATLIDIAQNTPSISSKCRSELIDAFSAEDKLYLTKLYADSSHNKDDISISFYHSCSLNRLLVSFPTQELSKCIVMMYWSSQRFKQSSIHQWRSY